METVLKKLEEHGVTLNFRKCEFSKPTLTFLGHVVGRNGISADPEKIKAVVEMETPKNVSEVRRLMGMTNQLAKFLPNLADITQPIRELLSTKNN